MNSKPSASWYVVINLDDHVPTARGVRVDKNTAMEAVLFAVEEYKTTVGKPIESIECYKTDGEPMQ